MSRKNNAEKIELKPKKILLKKDEEILWANQPKNYFSITVLEAVGMYGRISPMAGLQGFILLFAIFNLGDILDLSKPITVAIYILLWGGLFIIPDLIKNKKKSNTTYFVTNKRVIIEHLKFTLRSSFEMPLSDIETTKPMTYKNGVGFIEFVSKSNRFFWHYDLVSFGKTNIIEFELIENAVDEFKKINSILREKKKTDCNNG